jgi:tRNA A37 threonylcarbamoyladenosine biosynthesis protein TsaE
MGQKTSIYLPDDMAAKIKASGVPLIEWARRGLEAGDPESMEATMRRVLREERAETCGHQAGSAG